MAHIEAVCTSEKKGIVKRNRGEVTLKSGWGIENDAHAGKWHRQVSLLAGESIDTVKTVLPTLKNGAFAENIVTRGIDLTCLKVGDRLRMGGEVILEITQIGKECHNSGCAHQEGYRRLHHAPRGAVCQGYPGSSQAGRSNYSPLRIFSSFIHLSNPVLPWCAGISRISWNVEYRTQNLSIANKPGCSPWLGRNAGNTDLQFTGHSN